MPNGEEPLFLQTDQTCEGFDEKLWRGLNGLLLQPQAGHDSLEILPDVALSTGLLAKNGEPPSRDRRDAEKRVPTTPRNSDVRLAEEEATRGVPHEHHDLWLDRVEFRSQERGALRQSVAAEIAQAAQVTAHKPGDVHLGAPQPHGAEHTIEEDAVFAGEGLASAVIVGKGSAPDKEQACVERPHAVHDVATVTAQLAALAVADACVETGNSGRALSR